MDLGAGPLQAFFKVVFPDIMPGVLSGFLMAFTMSLDDFIITHFTRGAGINTLSTLIYSEVRRGIKPSMYALSTVIFVTILALLLITNFAPAKPQAKAGAGSFGPNAVPDKEKKPLWNGKTAIVLASFLIVGSVCYTSYLHFTSSHSNELYVYNWGEYIDESVIDEFEAETGIHVTYDLFETNEEMYPVIEAGAVSYDAVCPSDYMIQKMVENGLLAEINFENVPNIANIDPVYLEKSKAFDPENRYSVPYTWGTVGIIYNVQKLEELGCGALLAVNQGSRREAAMVVLRYEGAPGTDWTALVGKGLMFDAGGYHLKSIDGMNGMKYDMCGAAEMLEMLEYLVTQKVEKNVMAVLMLAENVISPDAVKMGDVITTLAGKTVEVYNTDAEGRLVLCDGITFAQRMGARTVIDLATLTYSAQSALGDQVVALFGNDREALRSWEETAEQTGEYYWQLPMGPIYHRMIEWSICADFANYAPGRGAGASVAACFLENFVEDGTQWIHLDMVGPSVVRKETDEMAEGASGACMSTLAAYLTR